MSVKRAIIIDEESLDELDELLSSLDVETGSLLSKLYDDKNIKKSIVKMCENVFSIAKILKIWV